MSGGRPEGESAGGYRFEGVPVGELRPGTSVLVAGSPHDGATELALRMVAGGENEGTVLITTTTRAERLLDRCRDLGVAVSPDRTGVVDCVGDREDGLPARVMTVGGPEDLTGIGIRFSTLSNRLRAEGVERIRTGLLSVSTLLSLGELRTVSRFVHAMAGRVDVDGGLGVFLADPGVTDDRALSTVGQFCDTRIDVRDGDGGTGPELRVRGGSRAAREWTAFDPHPD